MGYITRNKVWADGDTLYPDDLNGEFDLFIAGLSDGTKTINVATLNVTSLTAYNTATFTGNIVCNVLTISSNLNPGAANTYTLGNTTNAWTGLALNNGESDGGGVYFDGNADIHIRASADGNTLYINVGNVSFSNSVTVSNTLYGTRTALTYQGRSLTTTSEGLLGTSPYQYTMPLAGSLVGVTVYINVAAVAINGNLRAVVKKDGAEQNVTTEVVVNAAGDYTIAQTFARGASTFLAEEAYSVYLEKIGAASCNVNAAAVIEVVYTGA